MALTLNTTLADEFANSYADVAYADAYWEGHYSTVKAAQWAALTSPQKINLLIQSCRIIETLRFTNIERPGDYVSSRLHYDRRSHTVLSLNERSVVTKWNVLQRLQFPRNYDRNTATGALYIPEPVLLAQCEQAVYTMNFDDTAVANRLQGVTEDITTVGNIHLRQNYAVGGTQLSPTALDLVRPYLLATSVQIRRQ